MGSKHLVDSEGRGRGVLSPAPVRLLRPVAHFVHGSGPAEWCLTIRHLHVSIRCPERIDRPSIKVLRRILPTTPVPRTIGRQANRERPGSGQTQVTVGRPASRVAFKGRLDKSQISPLAKGAGASQEDRGTEMTPMAGRWEAESILPGFRRADSPPVARCCF